MSSSKNQIEEMRLHRRELLASAGALGALALLGPSATRAATGRGLKDIVLTRTFDVEIHIANLEWWVGEGLPAERPYSREQLVDDATGMMWQEGEPGFEENLERLRRHKLPVSHIDLARVVLDEFDAAGLDTGCNLIVDHAHVESNIGRHYQVPYERTLEDCAEMRATYPGRFYTFAGIDPRRGGAEGAALLRKALSEYGCSGLGEQVLQQYDIFPSDRELCYPLYEVCVEFNVPFYGNCEGPAPETLPTAYEQVAKDFPELKICLAGSGRPRPRQEVTEEGWAPTDDAIRLAATYENIYLDTADWQRRDPALIRRYLDFLRKCFDSDARTKVMFASDYPVFVAMSSAKHWVDVMLEASEEGLTFSDEEIALFYSANPLRFLSSVL